MVGRPRKIKKKHWLKRPKSVPKKRNLDQNVYDSKSEIWNSCFESIISGIQLFYICPHVPVDIVRVFLVFFSSRKYLKPTKTSEKDRSFYNKVSLKKPHLFCEPQLKSLSDFTSFLANIYFCLVLE